MPKTPSPAHHAVSHIGLVHHENEDSWTVLRTADGGMMYVVCDGMGGMGHGDEASQLAVRILTDRLRGEITDPAAQMSAVLADVDVTLRKEMCAGGRGLPGTTAILAFVKDDRAHVAWVGDSRIYWIRGGKTLVRTRDHKLVEELVMVGQLTEEEARTSALAHVVTRAIGGRPPDEPAVEPSTLPAWELQPGDTIVLCSDGLCDLASDAEIATATVDRTPREVSEALLALALERGGHDNITVITVAFGGRQAARPAPVEPVTAPPEAANPMLELAPWLIGGGVLGTVAAGLVGWLLG